MQYRIGIDAGGTKVAYGLFDESNKLIDRFQHPTPITADGPEFCELVIESATWQWPGQGQPAGHRHLYALVYFVRRRVCLYDLRDGKHPGFCHAGLFAGAASGACRAG